MHAPPLLFLQPQPSRRLAVLIGLIHILAALAVSLAGLPWWLPPPIVVLLAVSAWHLIRVHALLAAPDSLIRLQGRADGNLECLSREGEWLQVELLPDSTLFPWCAVLRLRPAEGRARSMTLLPDALTAREWRELRVWMRWAASVPGGRRSLNAS